MNTPQQIHAETDQAIKGLSLIARIKKWWSGPHKTWGAINRAIASAHPSVKEVGEIRRIGLQAWISVVLALFFIMGAVASAASRRSVDSNEWVLIVLTVVMLAGYGLSRSPYYGWGGWLVTGSVVVAGYGFALTGQATSNVLNSFIPLAFVLGSILLPPWSLLFWVVVGVSAMFLIPARFGIDVGTASGNFITLGGLLMVAIIFRNSVERSRLEELRSANDALKQFQSGLEQRVAERTKALVTSAEVTRRLTAVTDPHRLAVEVVDQVQLAFDYYHAHIYFRDEATGDLVMAGGTGEAGAAMLASGHRVQKGRGLVGRAADTNAPVLVPDVSQSAGWLPNPLLPETKSEVAVPISTGEEVLGVLDVQQNQVNGLTEDDVTLLQSIAGQVAISLQNARSFEQSKAQAEMETLVNTIGQQIQRTATVEEALQTAIRGIGMALGASRVKASIERPTRDN